jgi:hypothetical protein
MGDLPDGPPVVPLPERLDRRLRLGPFASARVALRFVTYAAVGAVVAPFTTSYVWLAIAAGGFAVCVVRSDGQSLDERGFSFLLWKLRTWSGGGRVRPDGAARAPRQGLFPIRPGQYVAILRTGGTPVTYLPPAELARRFELFRDLIRSLGGGIAFLVTSTPMRAGPVTPRPLQNGGPDEASCTGYMELVSLLCRRRQIRRVYLALGAARTGPDSVSDLETRASALADRLASLGLRSVRLRDRGLADAARRWGW